MADKYLITVNPENLSEFTHLHECIFPLKFPKKFYREAVTPTKLGIHHIAASNDKYVGVLSACVIKEENDDLHPGVLQDWLRIMRILEHFCMLRVSTFA